MGVSEVLGAYLGSELEMSEKNGKRCEQITGWAELLTSLAVHWGRWVAG